MGYIVNTHIHIYIYTLTYVYTYIHLYTHIYTYTCTYRIRYIHVYACCYCTYTHTQIYLYIHRFLSWRQVVPLMLHELYIYGMSHKKIPVFRNTLPCNGNFAFRVHFRSVLQFPCFYCCVSILKVRRRERLKNGKKNAAKKSVKTVQRSVFFPLPFFLTIVPFCLYLDKKILNPSMTCSNIFLQQ